MASEPPAGGSRADDPDKTRVDAAPASQPTTLLDGKYRVERVIGEGAFGRVFLAQDTRLRRPVAVKELLASRNSTDPDLYERYLDRFGREARAGGAITHPNVVTVYEMGIDAEQNTYLVMEYVDGTNLRDLLSQVGTLPVERVVAIALDIAKGLEAVHEQDIVHRDLKPANIMISRRGGAKVGDFGIAQVGTESQRTQVSVGHPGTPLYMSPEQSTGYGYIDGRSDLYSLGLIIYEMLVGEPYARRRVPLAQAKPETPPALVAIVERLLQKDPDRRFQSASDVVTELSRLSSAPQSSLSGGYGFASGQPPYQPPSQAGGNVTGAPGAIPGVPAAYGGPPSQQPGGYSADPRSQSGMPYPAQTTQPMQQTYGQGSGPPPASYQSQQPLYPPPGGPQPRKRGLSPLGIIGIVVGAIILILGALALIGALAGGGSKDATATPVSVAGNTTATAANATLSAVSTTTLGTANAASTAIATSVGALNTPTATTARASSTPGSTPSTAAGASPTARTTASASATPRGTASGTTATAFPTASGKVTLAAGKPLPATVLPQIYVDDRTRYTLHYPADWTQGPGDENTDVHFELNGTTLAGVTTEDLNGAPKPTVQQIADQLVTSFSKELTNFKVTDASQVKVGSMDAVRLLYTFTDSKNTVTLGGYLLGFATDKTLVLFQGYESSATFANRVPIFDAVAASFTGGFDLANSYTSASKGFSFDYPGDWSEKKSSVSAVAVLVAPDAGTPSFNVVTDNAGGRTLQQYYDANVRTVSNFKSYKKMAESDTTVGGQPAKLLIYTADVVGNGTILELHQWYIVRDGTGYVLTYSAPADRARDFAGTGPAIASTFAFS
jgi:serine/threonine protein kinase